MFWNLLFLGMVVYRVKQLRALFSDSTEMYYERRLFFMLLCYVVYALGSLLKNSTDPKVKAAGSCLSALQPFLHAVATNERRISRSIRSAVLWLIGRAPESQSSLSMIANSHKDSSTTVSSSDDKTQSSADEKPTKTSDNKPQDKPQNTNGHHTQANDSAV